MRGFLLKLIDEAIQLPVVGALYLKRTTTVLFGVLRFEGSQPIQLVLLIASIVKLEPRKVLIALLVGRTRHRPQARLVSRLLVAVLFVVFFLRRFVGLLNQAFSTFVIESIGTACRVDVPLVLSRDLWWWMSGGPSMSRREGRHICLYSVRRWASREK